MRVTQSGRLWSGPRTSQERNIYKARVMICTRGNGSQTCFLQDIQAALVQDDVG